MLIKYKNLYLKTLYIFFIFLSLNLFFFSTTNAYGKAFDINNIEISRPFKLDFNKNEVIDEGFKEAFIKLSAIILNSADQKKINFIRLNEIKGLIETFSIKEEKFVNETYFLNLGVSFNKKKVYKFLEKKNIFPSIPIKKKILFLPIIIDEDSKDLSLFSENEFYNQWNKFSKDSDLIRYILPSEDLEDLNLIRDQYEFIEKYNFKPIIDKYNLNDSIIALIFKDINKIKILSRITLMDKTILKNETFANVNFDNINEIEKIIYNLRVLYDDYWKNLNQINTSIKLNLFIKVNSSDSLKVSNFEKILNKSDLINDFLITKYNYNFIFYKIIFNGTANNFLKLMDDYNYSLNTQNKVWVLQ